MQQICSALATDVIDERDTLPPVVFRSSVLSLQDCKKDMPLLGVVRNIVAFGAFVDVGVDTDGALASLQLCLDMFMRRLRCDPDVFISFDVIDMTSRIQDCFTSTRSGNPRRFFRCCSSLLHIHVITHH